MALLKACTVLEQNANTQAGYQIDTSIYVGTGLAGIIPIRVNREAPVYIIQGTQTAAVVDVVLDTVNAYAGACINVRFGTNSVGTSTIRLLNATTGGTVIAQTTANVAPNSEHNLFATYDGTSWK